MDRRESLKALASLTVATGMTLTPVTTQEVQGVELVLVKCPEAISDGQAKRLTEAWAACVAGTSLSKARVIVLDNGMSVEFFRNGK